MKETVKHNDFSIRFPQEPTCEIWIAEDVVIHCRAKPRWWQKLFIKSFFGWKYKEKT